MNGYQQEKPETRLWRGVSHGILTEYSEQVQDQAFQPPILSPRFGSTSEHTASYLEVYSDNYIRFGGVEQPFSRCIVPFRREGGAVMSNSKLQRLGLRDGWNCHYCKVALMDINEKEKCKKYCPGFYHEELGYVTSYSYILPKGLQWPSADHKIPRSKGGKHSLENLVLACRSCNAKKSNRYTYEEFLAMSHKEL